MSMSFIVAILFTLLSAYLSGLAVAGDHIHNNPPSLVADIILWVSSSVFLALFWYALESLYKLLPFQKVLIICAVATNVVVQPIVHFVAVHNKKGRICSKGKKEDI